VGYYNAHTDKLNDFQAVLIDRSDTGQGNFDIEFNYGQLLWESGDQSGGVNGIGGASARAGFSFGSGQNLQTFELSGSGVNGALLDGGPSETSLVQNSLNSDATGRYLFYARDGQVFKSPEDVDNPNDGGDGGDDGGNGGGNDGGVESPPTIPEPTTFVLAGAGVVILAVSRWRKGPGKNEK
jgi:hypothetical protein